MAVLRASTLAEFIAVFIASWVWGAFGAVGWYTTAGLRKRYRDSIRNRERGK
jgi:hypothetical protein